MLPIIADAIGSVVMGIINKFFPNTEQEKKDELAAALQAQLIQSNIDIAQIATNTEEAKSDNLFVAGWRPACGWLCVSAMAYVYLFQPFIALIANLAGHPVALPNVDVDSLLPVLLGMLGLGSLRTYEKIKGVATK